MKCHTPAIERVSSRKMWLWMRFEMLCGDDFEPTGVLFIVGLLAGSLFFGWMQ